MTHIWPIHPATRQRRNACWPRCDNSFSSVCAWGMLRPSLVHVAMTLATARRREPGGDSSVRGVLRLEQYA